MVENYLKYKKKYAPIKKLADNKLDFNGSMKDKVVKELGYTSFSSIKKLSATETEYLPSDNSRQANALDPLDP
jgi:hypothetical protein